MKWILCGKNNAAVASLEFLVGQGDEVWTIGNRGDDGRDGWQRSLKAAARRLGMPFDQPPKISDPEFVSRLARFGATAMISIQYEQILRANLFRAIGCPVLNLHFALLPRHRGVAPVAWAILEGDDRAGVTFHHMVEDIDAGDVIAQRELPIDPELTARELYDRLTAAATSLFQESYPFGSELLGRHRPQDPSRGCYHRGGDLDFSNREVDWKQPAAELQRWLRAWIFPPLQLPATTLNGRRVLIRRVAGVLGPSMAGSPGDVLANSEAGIEVAAADRSLRITELADPANPDLPAEGVRRSIVVNTREA